MTSGKKEKGYFGLTYKIIVLGESNTDKSALIKRYIYNGFHSPTIGKEIETKIIYIENKEISLQI